MTTEQETKPQAWMLVLDPGVFAGVFRFKHDAENAAIDAAKQFSIVPLYHDLPSRKLNGLTDEEILDAADNAPFHLMVTADDYIYMIARAIEAKLKEKNND